jgi:hypothetical protein
LRDVLGDPSIVHIVKTVFFHHEGSPDTKALPPILGTIFENPTKRLPITEVHRAGIGEPILPALLAQIDGSDIVKSIMSEDRMVLKTKILREPTRVIT